MEGREALSFLAKSRDDISAKTIRKDQLQLYKEMFKEHGITFASISYDDNEYAKILFKTKQEEKVAAIVDKMEEVANKLDEKQEKEAYDIMKNLDFREVGENVYRQNEVMTAEQVVSMKEELEKKGIKSEVVINKVLDDNKYEVDFKISMKDKEKVKKPLDALIEGVLHQKKKNPEVGRMIEETRNNPYSFYEEPERKERFERMVESKKDLTTISVHQKNVIEFEREANKNGITTVPIGKEDGKYTKMLIEKDKEKEAKKILNKIRERGEMER
jgi:uncharacterized protein (DUF885 family)